MNILVIVVLYRCRIENSNSIASLIRSWESFKEGGLGLKVIIYDNSPEAQSISIVLPFEHEYVHDPANSGLACAYNYALKSNLFLKYKWLLLLDQDTSLPGEYFGIAADIISKVENDNAVVAIVPQVAQGNRPISPALHRWGARIKPLKKPDIGFSRLPITAINSGTLIRRAFLNNIGGFNTAFKLDFLDHWLFSEINRSGVKIYIAGTVLEHDLSINNDPVTMDPLRYKSIIQAENLFYSKYGPPGEYKYFLLHLFVRSVSHLFHGRKLLWKVAVESLFDFMVRRKTL